MEIAAAITSITRLERQYVGRRQCRADRPGRNVRTVHQIVLDVVKVTPQRVDIECESGDDRKSRSLAYHVLKERRFVKVRSDVFVASHVVSSARFDQSGAKCENWSQ